MPTYCDLSGLHVKISATNISKNSRKRKQFSIKDKIVIIGFKDVSTLLGHFVSSPREREKRGRRNSRGDESGGQGRKWKLNESEQTTTRIAVNRKDGWMDGWIFYLETLNPKRAYSV